MSSDLAIRIHLLTLYTILLLVFLAILIFFKLELYWHILFLCFLLIPESIMSGMIIFFSKLRGLLLTIFFILAAQLGLLFLYIKQFRAEFSPTPITESKIVAFTQFSGYPFWFDTIVFLALLLLPVLIIVGYRVYHAFQKNV